VTETETETELCRLPSDSGSCDAYVSAYYYDPLTRRCQQFVWTGCGGNANRFTTISECEQRCIYLETIPPPTRSSTTTTAIVLPTGET